MVKPLSRAQLNAGMAEAFSRRALINAARNTAIAAIQLNNLRGVRPYDRQNSSGIYQSHSSKDSRDSNRNILSASGRNSIITSITSNGYNNTKLNHENSESDIRIPIQYPSTSGETARNGGLITMDFTIEEASLGPPVMEDKPESRGFFGIPALANLQQNIMKTIYRSDREGGTGRTGGTGGAGETGGVDQEREEGVRRIESL